jgi:hypothetical protein
MTDAMPRWTNWAMVTAFVLFAWALAGFAALFGELTCESGCFGPGPRWTQDPEAAEWGYYWPLGIAFAICASLAMVFARRGRRAKAGAVLLMAAAVAAVLWWRVNLASPNSAGDLWIWIVGGLAVGVSALLTAPDSRQSASQPPALR